MSNLYKICESENFIFMVIDNGFPDFKVEYKTDYITNMKKWSGANYTLKFKGIILDEFFESCPDEIRDTVMYKDGVEGITLSRAELGMQHDKFVIFEIFRGYVKVPGIYETSLYKRVNIGKMLLQYIKNNSFNTKNLTYEVCPICKSTNIEPYLNFPNSMMNCLYCGSEWNKYEVIFNADTDV